MYDRFQVEEFDTFGTTAFTWIVDVPRDQQHTPSAYKISRKKGPPHFTGNFTHLDGPGVKQSSLRSGVEKAVLARMQGATNDVMLVDNVPKYRIAQKGTVQRHKSPQHKRLHSPLHVIGLEQRDGKYRIDAILEQESPVRYQAVVGVDPGNSEKRTFEFLVYRRSNPRGKGAPEYKFMAMSAGRKKVATIYTEEQAENLERAFKSLEANLTNPGKLATAVNRARQIFNQEHYGYTSPDGDDLDTSSLSIASRLRDVSELILDALKNVSTYPNEANRSRWENIRQNMLDQRARLTPIFEQYLRELEVKAFLRRAENDHASMRSNAPNKSVPAQAPQTPAKPFIPRMPTYEECMARDAAQAAKTPANATPSALADIANLFNQQ